MDRCDLHIHSSFSDSDADLESIFKQAHEKELRCIAITDHDTVDGIPQARIYSKKFNIELIDALELSAYHKDAEVHILGYFIDADNSELNLELSSVRELRQKRLSAMADKLNSLGVRVNKLELFSRIKGAIPTRLHLALYLIKTGKAKSLLGAFKKYLSPRGPAYVSCFKFSAKEAIELIKRCGGIAILAHPHMIPNQSWVEELISYGVDGLEVAYHNMPQVKILLYKSIVLKAGLLKSGGSDAHGSYKEFTQVGGVTVDYSWVREMKKYKK